MTERTICELIGTTTLRRTNFLGQIVDDIIDEWHPLDPQPCCENCTDKRGCGILEFLVAQSYPTEGFYCTFWELKE